MTHFETYFVIRRRSHVREISVKATKLNAWTTNVYVVDVVKMVGTHS